MEQTREILSTVEALIAEMATNQLNQPSALAAILSKVEGINAALAKDISFYLGQADFPEQTYSGLEFSQLPITVLNKNGLHLDFYHWEWSDTSIHDHNFAGAFKVLQGSYTQQVFNFNVDQKANEWLAVGELVLIKDEELDIGAVVEIAPGEDFIHSTAHPGGSCITACLRTVKRIGVMHSYVAPHLRLTHLPLSQQVAKQMAYIKFVNDKTKAEPVMKMVASNWLAESIFGINPLPGIDSSEMRELAFQILESRHKSESWFQTFKKCIELNKAN